MMMLLMLHDVVVVVVAAVAAADAAEEGLNGHVQIPAGRLEYGLALLDVLDMGDLLVLGEHAVLVDACYDT